MSAIQAPVFILAAPFSGASLLAAQLGAHPQLCVIPETNLFCADDVGALLEIFEISQGANADGLLRALAELEFGAQTDANVALAREWLAAHKDWTTSAVLAHLAARAAPRRLVLPDTDAVLRIADLKRLQRGFADAAIIQLVRHPWTQGALLAHWLAERLFVAADFRDFSVMPAAVDPQIAWYRTQRNLEMFLQPAYAARWQRVQIETFDDAATAAEALSALCAGLGLDAAALVEAPVPWSFAGFGPPAAAYGFEPELLEVLPPVPDAWGAARLAGPLSWRRDGKALAAEVIELAERYGYR